MIDGSMIHDYGQRRKASACVGARLLPKGQPWSRYAARRDTTHDVKDGTPPRWVHRV